METDRSVLDGIFRRCPIGISVHAPDLRILRVNRAIARFGGAPAELLRGLRIGDFLIAPDADTVERHLRGVLETGRPLIFTEQSCRLLSDPGQERVVSVSAFRMEDPSGRVLGVTQMVQDVTDRHRAMPTGAAQQGERPYRDHPGPGPDRPRTGRGGGARPR